MIVGISCKKRVAPPPPLDVTINFKDFIGYACVNNPVVAAYNGYAELKIQVTGQSKPEFSSTLSFYGQNPSLDLQGKCATIQIPKDDAFTATGVLLIKGTSNCSAAPEDLCQKWFKVESFPAMSSSSTVCSSNLSITIDRVDPAVNVPCNL